MPGGGLAGMAERGLAKGGKGFAKFARGLAKNGCFVEGTPVVWIASDEPPLLYDPATYPADKDISTLVHAFENSQTIWVAARNEQSGKVEWKRVTNAWERAVSAVVTVEFGLEGDKSGAVVESLMGTVEHPVYTERGWVGLGELGIGMKIVTRAGPRLVVKSVRRLDASQVRVSDRRVMSGGAVGIAVFNFTVDGHHTYFVGKASGGVWVHNAWSCSPIVHRGHILVGNINNAGHATGFHSEGIHAMGKARVVQYELDALGNRVVDTNGVYLGKVEVFNSATGTWVPKVGNGGWSTFYPRGWSNQKIESEIMSVYNNQTNHAGNMFYGKSSSGVWIQGFTDPAGNIKTAYPIK